MNGPTQHGQWHSRRLSRRRGTVLFEALLAIVVLILSVFAFSFLFTSNTGRLSKTRDKRDVAVFADSVLSSLRALSDEEARKTNWLGFWTTNCYVTNSACVLVASISNRVPVHFVRYTVSVALTNDSVGLTNCAIVLVQAWPGEHSATNSTNRISMYAEFRDTGAL